MSAIGISEASEAGASQRDSATLLSWFYNTWFHELSNAVFPAMDARLRVALNLRRLRVSRGISQDDLALAADIERAYAGHLERGGKNPTVTTLEKLAIALSCDISELFSPLPDGANPLKPLKSGRKPST
jgi:DNA-binding XRE family transcriptional regulator